MPSAPVNGRAMIGDHRFDTGCGTKPRERTIQQARPPPLGPPSIPRRSSPNSITARSSAVVAERARHSGWPASAPGDQRQTRHGNGKSHLGPDQSTLRVDRAARDHSRRCDPTRARLVGTGDVTTNQRGEDSHQDYATPADHESG